jgi:hypothetical protein
MKTAPLGDLSLESFLAEYWQKKPLLVRNALPKVKPPITADELAGLACEEEVEARLIIQEMRLFPLCPQPIGPCWCRPWIIGCRLPLNFLLSFTLFPVGVLMI